MACKQYAIADGDRFIADSIMIFGEQRDSIRCFWTKKDAQAYIKYHGLNGHKVKEIKI